MGDEEALVAAWLDGDDDAFAALVELHQAYVRAVVARTVAARHEVDDLAQETFLAAYRGAAGYDRRAPLRAWLAGIARNLALTHARRECRRRLRERSPLNAVIDAYLRRLDQRAAEPADEARELAELQRCLDALPPSDADVVRGFYFRGEAAAAIARRNGTSANNVNQLLFRLREALRRCVRRRLAGEGVGDVA